MKNRYMKKMKRKLHTKKIKGNLLMEMAEDIKDFVENAKIYKKMTGKK